MSEGLCWKCKEKYGTDFGRNPAWYHCHHEKCWCEKLKNGPWDMTINGCQSMANFCPQCGKPLTG